MPGTVTTAYNDPPDRDGILRQIGSPPFCSFCRRDLVGVGAYMICRRCYETPTVVDVFRAPSGTLVEDEAL